MEHPASHSSDDRDGGEHPAVDLEGSQDSHSSGPHLSDFAGPAQALLEGVRQTLADQFTASVRDTFAALRTDMHARPLYVMFEELLGCNPLSDHQAPKDVYPVFREMVAKAEQRLSGAAVDTLSDVLSQRVAQALQAEAKEKRRLQREADDVTARYVGIKARQKHHEQLLQATRDAAVEERTKLYAEINSLREQLHQRGRIGERYRPDGAERYAPGQPLQITFGDGAREASPGGPGGDGDGGDRLPNPTFRALRDQVSKLTADNRELTLRVKKFHTTERELVAVQERLDALTQDYAVAMEESNQSVQRLTQMVGEKADEAQAYERELGDSQVHVEELQRQLRTSTDLRRIPSSQNASTSNLHLSRENDELRQRVYELEERAARLAEGGDAAGGARAPADPELVRSLQASLEARAAEVALLSKRAADAERSFARRLSVDASSSAGAGVGTEQVRALEARLREAQEENAQLSVQLEQFIAAEAEEINHILEANEALHRQKLKNAVESAVCIDAFNESINAARRACLDFNDVGVQAPERRAGMRSKLGGSRLDASLTDSTDAHLDQTRDEMEHNRIQRSINAARKIYAARLPSLENDGLDLDIASIDDVFKKLFSNAKDVKTKLMRKHQESLRTEAAQLMRNLKLNEKLAAAIGEFNLNAAAADQPNIRDATLEDLNLHAADPGSAQRAAPAPASGLRTGPVAGADADAADADEADDGGQGGQGGQAARLQTAPVSNLEAKLQEAVRMGAESLVGKQDALAELRASNTAGADGGAEADAAAAGDRELAEIAAAGASARALVESRKRARERLRSASKSPAIVLTAPAGDARVASTADGRLSAQSPTTRRRILRAITKSSHLVWITQEAGDGGQPVYVDNDGNLVPAADLYRYGYILDPVTHALVYLGDKVKRSIQRRYRLRADANGDMVLPGGQVVAAAAARRCGYHGANSEHEFVFAGQPADILLGALDGEQLFWEKVKRINSRPFDAGDVLETLRLQSVLDDVTQQPVLMDPALNVQVPAGDAFRLGLLPDSAGTYRYAGPTQSLSIINEDDAVDPRGNIIKIREAERAGFLGPNLRGELTCIDDDYRGAGEDEDEGARGDEGDGASATAERARQLTAEDAPVDRAVGLGFLRDASDRYAYAGRHYILRPHPTDDEYLLDFLGIRVLKEEAIRAGYVQNKRGNYIYVGPLFSSNRIFAASGEDSEDDEGESARGSQRAAGAVKAVDPDMEVRIYRDSRGRYFDEDGVRISKKSLWHDYGYLADEGNRPVFVGMANHGRMVTEDAAGQCFDAAGHALDMRQLEKDGAMVVRGYDDHVRVYYPEEISRNFTKNVLIIETDTVSLSPGTASGGAGDAPTESAGTQEQAAWGMKGTKGTKGMESTESDALAAGASKPARDSSTSQTAKILDSIRKRLASGSRQEEGSGKPQYDLPRDVHLLSDELGKRGPQDNQTLGNVTIVQQTMGDASDRPGPLGPAETSGLGANEVAVSESPDQTMPRPPSFALPQNAAGSRHAVVRLMNAVYEKDSDGAAVFDAETGKVFDRESGREIGSVHEMTGVLTDASGVVLGNVDVSVKSVSGVVEDPGNSKRTAKQALVASPREEQDYGPSHPRDDAFARERRDSMPSRGKQPGSYRRSLSVKSERVAVVPTPVRLMRDEENVPTTEQIGKVRYEVQTEYNRRRVDSAENAQQRSSSTAYASQVARRPATGVSSRQGVERSKSQAQAGGHRASVPQILRYTSSRSNYDTHVPEQQTPPHEVLGPRGSLVAGDENSGEALPVPWAAHDQDMLPARPKSGKHNEHSAYDGRAYTDRHLREESQQIAPIRIISSGEAIASTTAHHAVNTAKQHPSDVPHHNIRMAGDARHEDDTAGYLLRTPTRSGATRRPYSGKSMPSRVVTNIVDPSGSLHRVHPSPEQPAPSGKQWAADPQYGRAMSPALTLNDVRAVVIDGGSTSIGAQPPLPSKDPSLQTASIQYSREQESCKVNESGNGAQSEPVLIGFKGPIAARGLAEPAVPNYDYLGGEQAGEYPNAQEHSGTVNLEPDATALARQPAGPGDNKYRDPRTGRVFRMASPPPDGVVYNVIALVDNDDVRHIETEMKGASRSPQAKPLRRPEPVFGRMTADERIAHAAEKRMQSTKSESLANMMNTLETGLGIRSTSPKAMTNLSPIIPTQAPDEASSEGPRSPVAGGMFEGYAVPSATRRNPSPGL